MAGGSGIYISWLMGAILLSLVLMPIVKPPWAKIRISGFVDMFRRYWAHMIVVFSVYLWKDLLDQLDRILMANTQLDMTPYVYAIEGDIVLWIQESFQNEMLSIVLTHFYVMGFMTATFASFVYPIYFDDRHMADRVSLSMFWVYILAIPFYLFFNVRVTGDHIPNMETIAYDLTPVIHNWFTRIDPFTNGMPSLHIGLPFAVWLTYLKWDDDGRWRKFRAALVIFIFLTGFTILYLGIHWILDIIGGVIVATVAVSLTEKTHSSIWSVADERLFSRRVARLIDNPKAWFRQVRTSISSFFEPIREPSSKQTSAVIVAILVGTGTVLLWDATHQDFPIEGVEWPTTAAGAGGWLIGIEENPDGSIEIQAWNTSTEESTQIGGAPWENIPSVTVTDTSFVLFSDSRLDFYVWEDADEYLTPRYRHFTNESISDILIAEDSSEGTIVGIVHSDHISYRSESGFLEFQSPTGPLDVCASSGTTIAIARVTDQGPAVEILSLASQFQIIINVNSYADTITDNHLTEVFGEPVEYTNATIVQLEVDSRWIAAVIDVGPVNRTILIDTISGEQRMLSDPVWPSSSVSLGHGKVSFLQIPRYDPTINEQDRLSASDVFLHDIEENRTTQLTIDEEVDQTYPQVLMSGVAWIEESSNGEIEIRIHSLEETFEPYSSVILQSSILMLIPLIVLRAFQSAREKRISVNRFNN